MKKLVKKVWNSLPISLRDKLRPKILLSIKTVYTVLGLQYLRHPIGRVSVPYFAKSNLRRSFAQQGEDLILDRIITRVLKWDITQKRN